jgi:hypothetical protein
MEDDDSDAEMADSASGTDFSDDVDPNFDTYARPHCATGRFRLPLLATLRSRGRQMAAACSLSRTLNRSRMMLPVRALA